MVNLFSLVLGLLAWGLGVAAIRKRGCPWRVAGSFTCCGAALLLQHMDMDHLARIGDIAALLDTAYARVFAGGVLLAVTVGLNYAALLRSKKK